MSVWRRLLGLDTLDEIAAGASIESAVATDGAEHTAAFESNIARAITRGTAVRKLIPQDAGLLAKYRIADYIFGDRLAKVRVNGQLVRMPAKIYFEERCREFMTISGADFGKPFNVELADTFIVIEIAPFSMATELVVIAPIIEEPTGSAAFDGQLALSAVLALLMVLDTPWSRLMLLDEVHALLSKLAGLGHNEWSGPTSQQYV